MIPFDPAPMTSYLRYIATMNLFRSISEINGDFSRKIATFPPHVNFALPLKGFPVGIVRRRKQSKTKLKGLPDGRKSFKISLAV